MGGRDQEMTFGIGKIDYTALYQATDVAQAAAVRSAVGAAAGTTTTAGPNQGAKFHLAHLPSDTMVAKEYGKAIVTVTPSAHTLQGDTAYVIKAVGNDTAINANAGQKVANASNEIVNDATGAWAGAIDVGDVFRTKNGAATYDVSGAADANEHTYAEVNESSTAFKAGHEYEIVSFGAGQTTTASKTVNTATFKDVDAIGVASSDIANSAVLTVGTKFTVDANITKENLARLNALTEGMTFRMASDTLTKDIEAIQALVNTARVQAGSQYAAIESAVNYTTDLTAQYELGYNTVNDVNFSMETAHLAKNQILQQAATAMLAQANSGQQGLLQLIS